MASPIDIVFCYEDRDDWLRDYKGKGAIEKARWLSPSEEFDFVSNLISQADFNPVGLSLRTEKAQFPDIFTRLNHPMFWNVTDGQGSFLGSLIPSLSRLHRIPWFGSSTYCQGICQNKHHWKAILSDVGISNLPYRVVRSVNELISSNDIKGHLTLPLFVKPATLGNNGGFSTAYPLVKSWGELPNVVTQLLHEDLGPVLIEEFAPGKELSVWAFQLQEWSIHSFYKDMNAPFFPTEIKDKLPSNVRYTLREFSSDEIALKTLEIIQCLDIQDYVRIDFREDANGDFQPIDINTGSFLTGRSFELAATKAAGSKEILFKRLVQLAYSRKNRSFIG